MAGAQSCPITRNGVGVRWTTRQVQTAHGHLLARLVVVVGVLAGLVLVHGVQCTDGMTAMATEHVANSSMAAGSIQHGTTAATAGIEHHSPDDITAAHAAHRVTAAYTLTAATAVSPLAGVNTLGSHGLCGWLAGCLVLMVAVMAIIVGLRPVWLRIFASGLTSRRAALIHTVHPRALSLTELCLLRT